MKYKYTIPQLYKIWTRKYLQKLNWWEWIVWCPWYYGVIISWKGRYMALIHTYSRKTRCTFCQRITEGLISVIGPEISTFYMSLCQIKCKKIKYYPTYDIIKGYSTEPLQGTKSRKLWEQTLNIQLDDYGLSHKNIINHQECIKEWSYNWITSWKY